MLLMMYVYSLSTPNRPHADVSSSEVNSKLASAYGLSNGTFGLEHFDYRSDAMTNITFDHLGNTSFNGITVTRAVEKDSTDQSLFVFWILFQGRVSFNKGGIRTTVSLSVHQLRTGILLLVLGIYQLA